MLFCLSSTFFSLQHFNLLKAERCRGEDANVSGLQNFVHFEQSFHYVIIANSPPPFLVQFDGDFVCLFVGFCCWICHCCFACLFVFVVDFFWGLFFWFVEFFTFFSLFLMGHQGEQ